MKQTYEAMQNVSRTRTILCERQPLECQLYEYLTQRMDKQYKRIIATNPSNIKPAANHMK